MTASCPFTFQPRRYILGRIPSTPLTNRPYHIRPLAAEQKKGVMTLDKKLNELPCAAPAAAVANAAPASDLAQMFIAAGLPQKR